MNEAVDGIDFALPEKCRRHNFHIAIRSTKGNSGFDVLSPPKIR